ncbi:protein LZIC-like [Daktulosphaira vitifoliae]|uniref:protein LZIC-like n=1 Tax=Daktulosphaira vitifoliae TaxID=58002 RepID=UPI0021AADD21|nr:protein LZIC-like [Daktulosphaira vitifoliae]XP_050523275.1 protein LZIC-like [Daktulosphaira vitifoliae]
MVDENSLLRENLEAQLDRLVQQLSDLEECRNDLTDEEYNETKEDTVEQLKEFNERLIKITSGNTTLHDKLSIMRLATSAAITKAFQTPSIIKLFAKNEPNALKEKRNQIDRDMKLGKISSDLGNRQKFEVLTALRHLGCKLTDTDKIFIQEEMRKLPNNTSIVGFNITDSLNGFDFNSFLRMDDNFS